MYIYIYIYIYTHTHACHGHGQGHDMASHGMAWAGMAPWGPRWARPPTCGALPTATPTPCAALRPTCLHRVRRRQSDGDDEDDEAGYEDRHRNQHGHHCRHHHHRHRRPRHRHHRQHRHRLHPPLHHHPRHRSRHHHPRRRHRPVFVVGSVAKCWCPHGGTHGLDPQIVHLPECTILAKMHMRDTNLPPKRRR